MVKPSRPGTKIKSGVPKKMAKKTAAKHAPVKKKHATKKAQKHRA
jgi:hypothetical protein